MSQGVFRTFVAAVAASLALAGCQSGSNTQTQAASEQQGTETSRGGAGHATESFGSSYSTGGITAGNQGKAPGGASPFEPHPSNAGASGSLGFGGAGRAGEPNSDMTIANGFGNNGQRMLDAGTAARPAAGGAMTTDGGTGGDAGAETAGIDVSTSDGGTAAGAADAGTGARGKRR